MNERQNEPVEETLPKLSYESPAMKVTALHRRSRLLCGSETQGGIEDMGGENWDWE